MSTKNADDDLSDLFKIFNNLNKGRIPEKISFLKNIFYLKQEKTPLVILIQHLIEHIDLQEVKHLD